MHDLYAPGGEAVEPVGAAFPGVVLEGRVDRQALSRRVVGADNEGAMRQLEGIVHPLVAAAREHFLAEAAAEGASLAVLDVPLLYETGLDARCDAVAVVSASSETQRARVLARPGMSAEKLNAILSRQLSDAEKRERASIVIDTGCSLEETAAAVRALVLRIKSGKHAELKRTTKGLP